MRKMAFVTTVRAELPRFRWRSLSAGPQPITVRQYKFPSYAARARFQQLCIENQRSEKPRKAHQLRLAAIRWAKDHDGSTPGKAMPVDVVAGQVIITQDMPRFILPVITPSRTDPTR